MNTFIKYYCKNKKIYGNIELYLIRWILSLIMPKQENKRCWANLKSLLILAYVQFKWIRIYLNLSHMYVFYVGTWINNLCRYVSANTYDYECVSVC